MCRCCLSWCGVLSCLVLRNFCVVWVASPMVAAETSQVVVSLALGIFSFPIDLNCKPLLECSCFIPGDVENAMTVISFTTRDIVEPIQPGCHCVHWHTLVSGRGGPTMGTSYTCIEKKNLARFPTFCYTEARSSQLTSHWYRR